MFSYSLPTGWISVWEHLEWDKYSAFPHTHFPSTCLPCSSVPLLPQDAWSRKNFTASGYSLVLLGEGYPLTSPYSVSETKHKIKPFRQLLYYKMPCLPFTFNSLTVVTDKKEHFFSPKEGKAFWATAVIFLLFLFSFLWPYATVAMHQSSLSTVAFCDVLEQRLSCSLYHFIL